MKPMVVSAAAAERTPRADPSVSAALPCRRCRREIFPKSMDRSFGGHAAAEFAAAPIRRSSEFHVAIFVPEPFSQSYAGNMLNYITYFKFSNLVENLCSDEIA